MNTPTTFKELVGFFLEIIYGYVFTVLIALILLVFFWRIIDAFIINADDETKRADGRRLAVIGFIVIFILMAVWSIVGYFRTALTG